MSDDLSPGDVVVVVQNTSAHGFQIGERVRLLPREPGVLMRFVNAEGDAWWLVEADFAPEEDPAPSFACAECGTTTAETYVVTTLVPGDSSTRTEVCRACDNFLQADELLARLAEHTVVGYGTTASPGHWSYEAKKRGEGDWFAHCSGGYSRITGKRGCGWTSEPVNYHTRDEAQVAARQHLLDVLTS